MSCACVINLLLFPIKTIFDDFIQQNTLFQKHVAGLFCNASRAKKTYHCYLAHESNLSSYILFGGNSWQVHDIRAHVQNTHSGFGWVRVCRPFIGHNRKRDGNGRATNRSHAMLWNFLKYLLRLTLQRRISCDICHDTIVHIPRAMTVRVQSCLKFDYITGMKRVPFSAKP